MVFVDYNFWYDVFPPMKSNTHDLNPSATSGGHRTTACSPPDSRKVHLTGLHSNLVTSKSPKEYDVPQGTFLTGV